MLKLSGWSCLNSGRNVSEYRWKPCSCLAQPLDGMFGRNLPVQRPLRKRGCTSSALQRTRCLQRDRQVRPSSKATRREGSTDAEAGMPSAEASGAICVQRLDDSRNSAIHIKYRISLRSSSLREPRYPLLRVVWVGEAPLSKRHSGFSFRECLVCGVRFRPASRQARTARPCPRLHRRRGRPVAGPGTGARAVPLGARTEGTQRPGRQVDDIIDSMIPPQVHLRRPCYDFSFL